MEVDDRDPFYNKIFYCDIVGYSRHPALIQFACQKRLNQVLSSVMKQLGTKIGKDVVALPTGDGVVLNFIAPEPDIHLRTALKTLERLNEPDPSNAIKFDLRIGLHSNVDTLVSDINDNKNVVGSGINMAQRVMDLGSHGQILMHDRVRIDLESYPEYAGKILFRGNFTVKHGQQLPIAQYVNATFPYISGKVISRGHSSERAIDIDNILERSNQNYMVSITIDDRGRERVDEILEYIEELLDSSDQFQRLKIYVPWIVNQMIDNAIKYGNISVKDKLVLRLRQMKSSILVELDQPDVPKFQLEGILQNPQFSVSFMRMMHRRGLSWRQRRIRGRLELGLEIPNNIDLKPMVALTFEAGEGTQEVLPASVASFRDGLSEECIQGGVLLFRLPAGGFDRWLADGTLREVIDRLSSSTALHGVVLDLGRVSYISSHGLRTLMMITKAVGGICLACNATPSVREILDITRFNHVCPLYDNSESAYRVLSISSKN